MKHGKTRKNGFLTALILLIGLLVVSGFTQESESERILPQILVSHKRNF
jgi:hypothetical protein